jgi:hypothetical protein
VRGTGQGHVGTHDIDGLMAIWLLTPATPVKKRALSAAAWRWYCHSTSPDRVRQGTRPAQDVLGRPGHVGVGALAEFRQLDLHLDADLLRMHRSFPVQFSCHVLLQLRISLHGCVFGSSMQTERAPLLLPGLCDSERETGKREDGNDFESHVFVAALSKWGLVRTLLLATRFVYSPTDCPYRLEFRMTQKTTSKHQRPASMPLPGRPSIPTPPSPPLQPAEPIEVLGRHKNTGQKDHKGAR